MPDYHVYVHLDARPNPVYGVATSNPPVLGGVVVHTFQHEQASHAELLRVAERLTGPLRFEYARGSSWELGTDKFDANDVGLQTARSMGRLLAEHGSSVRLVTAQGHIIEKW
jgi:hypothetical protein